MQIPKHGIGRLQIGNPGNKGGPGKPADYVRAKMRKLGYAKAIPFLRRVLEGEIHISLVGVCVKCKHEQELDAKWLELVQEKVSVSVADGLKASDILLKHGLASKELVIASDNARSFFDCVYVAAIDLFGEEGAEALKGRAATLMSNHG